MFKIIKYSFFNSPITQNGNYWIHDNQGYRSQHNLLVEVQERNLAGLCVFSKAQDTGSEGPLDLG